MKGLKRTQVLYEHWQIEEIKKFAERHNLSYSGACRTLAVVGLMFAESATVAGLGGVVSKSGIDKLAYEVRKKLEKGLTRK